MKKTLAVLILIGLLVSLAVLPKFAKAQGVKWTFMVYLDADNDLEDVGIDNFRAMAEVGSTDNVKIVVQFDRAVGYDTRFSDWTSTKRFLVTEGMSPTPAEALQDLGEQNMADPTTLLSFVQWATATYPADHYFLDLWDHGLGWQGIAIDDDPVSNDVMTAVELGSALSQVRSYIGRPLDIIANDACRMTLEIMYQIRQYAIYLVGSEKDEPLEGWPYNTVLGSLVANPSMTSLQLASTLVDRYVDSYRSGSSYSVTMALVNSSVLPQVVSKLKELVSAVNFTLPYSTNAVVRARNESEHYEGNQCLYPDAGDEYDLYDVATKLAGRIDNGRVIHASAALQAAIKQAVVRESHLDVPNPVNCVHARNATGLSLWYPWSMKTRQSAYEQLDISRDSLWNEHLMTYHNYSKVQASLAVSLSGQDRNLDGIVDTGVLNTQSSVSASVYLDVYLDDSLLSSDSYPVIAGILFQRNVSLPLAGVYEFYLVVRQSSGAVNATSIRDFFVNVTLTIRGIAWTSTGERIDGVNVTITNTRTNETMSAMTSQGLYTMSVEYPLWLVNGDRLVLEARKGNVVTRANYTLIYRGQRLLWIDVFLTSGEGTVELNATPFGDYVLFIFIPIAAMTVELFLLALIVRRARKRA